MKRKLVLALGLFIVFGSSLPASAGDTYVGVQYALGEYSEEGVLFDLNPDLLVGRVGKYINQGFSIEGRLGTGVQEDGITWFGTNLTLDIESLAGIYGRGHVRLRKSASIYGLLGVTRAEATASAVGLASASDDETGLSFGAGADLDVGSNVSLSLEYVQYLNKSEFDLRSIGLSVAMNF